ncbi:MAG: drug resistance transporter, Bcr/CflA subfamily [Betaproteobacteria bacterium]|nr:drug resistance transporter, Bcr/CflA subfamily [Betaproteobacteria bacterium]
MNPSALEKKDAPASRGIGFVAANGLALMLAGLAMLGPFSVDTYLPAFPNIQATLHATPIEVQQTLTAYMFAFAFMMLWHGALSDAFGRRNIVLGALGVFAVASLGCAAAHSVEYLWAFRILQGVSAGAGVVIGRAIIRDLYSGARATRLLSLVTMIFSIAPAIAPILGGWIVKLRDWRSIFLFLFVYTVLLFWYCYRKLPETLPPAKRQPFNPYVLARSYRQVFSSPLFQLKAGTMAFTFAGLFLYVAAAPVFLTQHLHLGPDQFGWQFVPMVTGIFLGALSANRMAGKISISRHVGIGFGFLIGATVANLLYHAFFPPALPWSVLPLLFYGLGFSIIAPVIMLLVMDLFPNMRGLVSSCQSFTQTMLGAVVAGGVAPLLSHDVLWLAAGQLVCVCIALALWLLGRSYHRAHEPAEVNAWETVPVE